MRFWTIGMMTGLAVVAACARGSNKTEDDDGLFTGASTSTGQVGVGTTTTGQGPGPSGPGPGASTVATSGVGGSSTSVATQQAATSGQGGGGGAPPQWTCDPLYYADGLCDCGCGVLDVTDCLDNTVSSCEYCDDTGSCALGSCPSNIDPTNNAVCVMATCGNSIVEPGEDCDDGNTMSGDGCDASCFFEVPSQWTCDPSYYGTMDGCDCGCGVLDPDCPNALVGSCGYCDDLGSCGTGSCPANINPTNNAVCI